jgi:hypothetical protein
VPTQKIHYWLVLMAVKTKGRKLRYVSWSGSKAPKSIVKIARKHYKPASVRLVSALPQVDYVSPFNYDPEDYSIPTILAEE